MSAAKITFHRIVQNTQAISPKEPNQEHMVSEAFFTLEYNGNTYADMHVVFRQPFGTNYESDPLEVEKPTGSYTGNWNHNAFRDAVEDYYRSAFGSGGSAISIRPGSGMIGKNNIVVMTKAYQIDIP